MDKRIGVISWPTVNQVSHGRAIDAFPRSTEVVNEEGMKVGHLLPQCHMLPQLSGCSGQLHKPNVLISIFLELLDNETSEVYVRRTFVMVCL